MGTVLQIRHGIVLNLALIVKRIPIENLLVGSISKSMKGLERDLQKGATH
jgi:hypothetical protein